MAAGAAVSAVEMALESAMLAALQADAEVSAVLGDPLRVVQAGSPKPAYPYLEIVRHVTEPGSVAGFEGSLHTVDLRVTAQDRAGLLAHEGVALVREVLSTVGLEMDGWRCVLMTPRFTDTVRMTDGSWRGLLRMKAAVEAA
jgi:hypothetical protein